jgi:hypothetical protein
MRAVRTTSGEARDATASVASACPERTNDWSNSRCFRDARSFAMRFISGFAGDVTTLFAIAQLQSFSSYTATAMSEYAILEVSCDFFFFVHSHPSGGCH